MQVAIDFQTCNWRMLLAATCVLFSLPRCVSCLACTDAIGGWWQLEHDEAGPASHLVTTTRRQVKHPLAL